MSHRHLSPKSLSPKPPALVLGLCCLALGALSARVQEPSGAQRFAQMHDLLPTPNTFRTASGAPGHEYWQQQAHYDIDVELDQEEPNQRSIVFKAVEGFEPPSVEEFVAAE